MKLAQSRAQVTALLLKLMSVTKGSGKKPGEFSRQTTPGSNIQSRRLSEGFYSSGSEDCDHHGPTTLMVRNIPPLCTCDMLLQDWPLDGSYDFLYLPKRAGGKATLGYAFINFTTAAHAEAFAARWRSQRLSSCPEGRALNITRAAQQGFEANMERLKVKSAGEIRSRRCEVVAIKAGRRISMNEL